MTRRPQSYAVGALLAAIGATCWSLGGALVRSTSGIDAWQIIFYRSVTVLVCMAIWLALRFGKSLPGHFAAAGANGVIAGILVGTAGLTYVAALFYTTVAQAIFMTGLSPFLAALIGWWILRERVPRLTWGTMSLALIGMGLIFYGSPGGGAMTGTALAIYSAMCFSCYAVLLRWGQKTEMSVALIWNALFLIAVSGAVIALPVGFRASGGLSDFAIGWWNLLAIAVMGVVQLSIGLILFTLGSRSVPAAQLSLIALIEPTLSPLWAWLVAAEVPPVWTFAGGAVILSAIVIQALFSATRESRHA